MNRIANIKKALFPSIARREAHNNLITLIQERGLWGNCDRHCPRRWDTNHSC